MPKRAAWSRSMVRVTVAPLVCWSLATSRSCGRPFIFSSNCGAQVFSSSILASCSVYWYCVRARRPPTFRSCGACMKKATPGTLGDLAAQARDDAVGRQFALVARLQGDEHLRVVHRPAAAQEGAIGRDVRVLRDNVGHLVRDARHLIERDILAGLDDAEDRARVLLREEALGDRHVEIGGRRHGAEENHQGEALVAQNPVEPVGIAAQQPVEEVFEHHVDAAVLRVFLVAQELRGHHRRQRQCHQRRDGDGHRHGQREFAEQASHDTAHQQQRNEHRHQRDADRQDGEADFARALESGVERLHPLFDMAVDVLQHHDRVIDHETDGDGQRHQRQIVQAETRDIHQPRRTDEGQGHRNARDNRRPDVAQEHEDHQNHQDHGDHQGAVHVGDGGSNRGGAIDDGIDLIAGGTAAMMCGIAF